MKSLRLLIMLLVAAVFITSCKKAVPAQTKFIPKNALFVAVVNSKMMQSKLAKNQSTIENIIRSVSGSDTTVSKGQQELEDLKSSGIDFDENLYVAIVQKGGGVATGKGSIVTSAVASLKDAKKLEAYIKKKDPASEVRKEKDYSYTTIQGDKIVAWGKDVIVMMSYQRAMSPADMEYDSTTGSFNLKNPAAAATDLKRDVEADFNLKEDQSVASVPEFRDLMQEKADVGMWINSSSSVEDLPLSLPKLKELLSNSFTAATVNFENGKITVNSKSYYSKDFRDLLKNYTGPTADLGLIENYPSDDINGFGVFSFNPQLIDGIVKYLEVGALVDSYLSKFMGANYTLQDALKAIKGDFAITISDFKTEGKNASPQPKVALPSDTSGEVTERKANLKMLMNIPVGDKVQMNRIMDKLVEMQMLVKANNEYKLNTALQNIGYQLKVDDKNIIVASDQNLLDQYLAKTKRANINKDVISDFKGKSGVAYINIESILNGINPVNAQGDSVLPKAKETFKDIEAYTNNFNGKFVEGHAQLRFKNEKESSLTSLLSFIETVSKNVKTSRPMVIYKDDVQGENGSAMRDDEKSIKVDTAYERGSAKVRTKKNK